MAKAPPQIQPAVPPLLVEVLDDARRVVAILPANEVARQKLRHRAIAILLFDDQGRLNLRRRESSVRRGTSRWDVPVRGPVLAGEAVLDAATRALKAELGIHAERLRPLLELQAQPENGNRFLHVFSLVRTEPAAPGAQDAESGDYNFTTEELDCLLRDFRDLVSPPFLQLAEALSLRGLWRRRP
ncbi:NUDIX domain-containing protein [Humidesulfovibrio idahonensis]